MAVLSVRTTCRTTQSHDMVPCAIVSMDMYGACGILPTQALITLNSYPPLSLQLQPGQHNND